MFHGSQSMARLRETAPEQTRPPIAVTGPGHAVRRAGITEPGLESTETAAHAIGPMFGGTVVDSIKTRCGMVVLAIALAVSACSSAPPTTQTATDGTFEVT
jgi:hypothetical protein